MSKVDRLTYLRDRLTWFEEVATEARSAGSYTAAVHASERAVRLRADIDEIEQVQAARQRRRASLSMEAYFDELLDTVHEIRSAAVASGSCIAANQAVKLEADLLSQKSAALDKAAASARAAMPDADLEAEILRLQRERGVRLGDAN